MILPRLIPLIALTACAHPPATPSDPVCAADETLDGAVCVPAACGVGTWGTLVQADDALYVDGAATADGDGSRDAPLRTVGDALTRAAAQDVTVIQVAAGTYAERLDVDQRAGGLSIQGRCGALVSVVAVDGDDDTPALTADLQRQALTLSGLSLEGGAPIVALESGALALTDVILTGGRWVGLDVYAGADATLQDVQIRDMVADADGVGVGFAVFEGATLTADGLVVQGAGAYGGYVLGGVLTLSNAEITGVSAPNAASGAPGIGLVIQEGDADLEEVSLSAVEGYGLRVTGRGAATARDLWVEDVAWSVDGGSGGVVDDASHLDWDGGGVQACGFGVRVEERATLTLRDVTLQDLSATEAGDNGIGVYVSDATATLDQIDLVAVDQVGVLAISGAEVDLNDVNIAGTGACGCTASPTGLWAEDGATLKGAGITVQDNVGTAVYANGAEVQLDGAVILHNDGFGAVGVQDAELSLVDVDLEYNQQYGVFLRTSRGTLEDVRIAHTAAAEGVPYGGRGIGAGTGSVLHASRVSIEDGVEVGILVDNSAAYLSEVQIRGVVTAPYSSLAVGLVAQGAEVVASRLGVQQIDGVGIYQRNGRLSCVDCVLTDLRYAGAMVDYGGTMALGPGFTVTNVGPDDNLGGGIGVGASDLLGASTLTVQDAHIAVTGQAAVLLDGPGTYRIVGSDLACALGGALGKRWPQADAVFATGGATAWDGTSGLWIADNTLRDAQGGAVFLDGASATLEGNTFMDVATDLIQQRCEGIASPAGIEALDSVELCPTYDHQVELTPFYFYLPPLEPEG